MDSIYKCTSSIQAEHVLGIGLSRGAEPVFLLREALETIMDKTKDKKATLIASRRGYNRELLQSLPGSDEHLLSFEEARSKAYMKSTDKNNTICNTHSSDIATSFLDANGSPFTFINDENSPFFDENAVEGRQGSAITSKKLYLQNELHIPSSIFISHDPKNEKKPVMSVAQTTNAYINQMIDNCGPLKEEFIESMFIQGCGRDFSINVEDKMVLENGEKTSNTMVIVDEQVEFIANVDKKMDEDNRINLGCRIAPLNPHSPNTFSSKWKHLSSESEFKILNEKNGEFLGQPLTRLLSFLGFCHDVLRLHSNSGRKSILPRKSFSSKASDLSKLLTDIYPFLLMDKRYRFVQQLQGSSYLIQEFATSKEQLEFFVLRKVSDFANAKKEEQISDLVNGSCHELNILFDDSLQNDDGFLVIVSPFISQHTIKDVVEIAIAISTLPDEIVALQLVKALLTLLVNIHSFGIICQDFSPEKILFVQNDEEEDEDKTGFESELGNKQQREFFHLSFLDFSDCHCNDETLPLAMDREKTSLECLISYIAQIDKSGFPSIFAYKEILWHPLLADIRTNEDRLGTHLKDTYVPIIDDILNKYQGFPSPLSRLQRISILLYEL